MSYYFGAGGFVTVFRETMEGYGRFNLQCRNYF